MAAGEAFGIAPYGPEALGVMRIEKGHVAGNELNGQTTARDLGLGRMVAPGKDFIGARDGRAPGAHRSRPAAPGRAAPGRTAASRLRAGAHFIRRGAPATIAQRPGLRDLGRVLADASGSWIGLGFLARGAERIGERVRAVDPSAAAMCWWRYAIRVFVDPEGARLRV